MVCRRRRDEILADLDVVRYWDLATTEKTEFNEPDWTVGVKLGCDKNGRYWLLDIVRARANPGDVDRLLLNTVEQDGKGPQPTPDRRAATIQILNPPCATVTPRQSCRCRDPGFPS
jgi:hypothetical protein